MRGPVVDALLPPAILALLALVLLASRRRRAAIIALLALMLFGTEGVPHVLITPLLLPRAAPPARAPGAIVVLAGGLPELLDTSRTTPSLDTLKRLRTAAALSRTSGTPILVSGARAADGSVPVGTQMARSLEHDFHVPAAWTETASTNLWQSAAASAGILHQQGIEDVYLVAQPWELRLAASVFRTAGLGVTPVAVRYGEARTLDLTAFAVDAPAWLDSALALREWTGLACQAVSACAAWMRTQPAE